MLINVSGPDKPGLMAMLTSTLAQYQVRVLDLGQAVIHDELNLGILVLLEGRDGSAEVLEELSLRARDLGVNIRFEPVSSEKYQDWVEQQGKPRYIFTLLAGGITAEQLAVVTSIIEQHGLNIDAIRRLTGRIPLDVVGASHRASIEMSVRGPMVDQKALKEAIFRAGGELTFDFSVQEDTVYRRNRRLVAFDMDSTLIQAEVIDELAKRHGVGDRVAAITEKAMRGEMDFSASLRERVKLLKGMSETALEEIASAVLISDGAQRLVSTLQHFGYKTAIISGGFTYVGERLQKMLGIDYLYANNLQVKHGRVTGEIQGEIVDADRKASILRELCLKEGISLHQSIAIGDGANDLPMLTVAGLGVAFHAKPTVRESASHSISNFGLDSVLYLLGFSDQEVEQTSIP